MDKNVNLSILSKHFRLLMTGEIEIRENFTQIFNQIIKQLTSG